MRLVIIESPYAGDVQRNVEYARKAVADSLKRGEAPFASHLLYTQEGILDDTKKEERSLGMFAGFEWGKRADLVAVYQDLGVTSGMKAGITRAEKQGIPVELRNIILLDSIPSFSEDDEIIEKRVVRKCPSKLGACTNWQIEKRQGEFYFIHIPHTS